MFSKVKERMGGRIETFISGSAALSKDVASWFEAVGPADPRGLRPHRDLGRHLREPHGSVRVGTVGMPFPGTEVKIADDGEILIRGGGVMRGYHNLPEQTAEVLIGDGWFATGDIGEIDDDGNLKITDRKKDLIKTSGGKYIAPSLIEARFKALCPLLGNVLVHANGRNYATAIVTLDPDVTAGLRRAPRHHRRSRRVGVGPDDREDGPRRDGRAQRRASTGGRPSRTSASSSTTCRSRRAS